MKFRLTIWLFLLLPVASIAQVDSVFRFERQWGNQVVDFYVDALGSLYILNKNDQLKKVDANGDSVAVFSAIRRYGQLYSIDVTNPLKILLYYKDFGTVVTLDRFLSVRNTLDLRRQNIFQAKAVGLAYDNNIWLFDEQEGRLKRIGEDGKLILQTNDLRLLFDTLPSPDFLTDQDGLVYLYDSVKGVYLFDYYGALKSRIPFIGWRDFMVLSHSIYGRKETEIFKYEPGSLDMRQIKIPPQFQSATRIRISQQKLYVHQDGVLRIYSYR
jgi:hypothetical protein